MLNGVLQQALPNGRDAVYITNAVKCRPPGNQTPTLTETHICSQHYLQAEFIRLNPLVVITLGNVATRAVLQTSTGITKLRGQWQTMRRWGYSIPVMPSWHPSYVDRFPRARPQLLADLCFAAERYQCLLRP